MKTVTLHDGRELTIDLYRVTMAEWRSLFDPKQAQAEEDAIVARILGIEADALRSLPFPDFRKAMKAVLDVGSGPLDDPNSQSASIEDSQAKETSQSNIGDGS